LHAVTDQFPQSISRLSRGHCSSTIASTAAAAMVLTPAHHQRTCGEPLISKLLPSPREMNLQPTFTARSAIVPNTSI
jgi:hypothetical protein